MPTIKEADIYIDSRNRNKIYKNILSSEIYYLTKDPIYIEENSNILKIYVENHSLVKDDLIIIDNVVSRSISDNFSILLDINRLKIDISKYILDFKNYIEYDLKISNLDNSKLKIFNVLNIKTIDNLNKNIKIEDNIYLIIELENNYYSNINLEICEITFTFKDINNIRLRNINSNYPLDENHNNGYKIIYETDPNYIYIENKDNSIKSEHFGGDNIIINKINYQEKGYENSNYYEINLFKIFYNVISIKIISSNFPNQINIISDNYNTNKFSWIDIEKNVYSINLQIQESNNVLDYMINKINQTKIVNTNNYFYLKKKFLINNFFEYNIYSKIILYQALSKLNLITQQTELLFEKINVYYPNHNLENEDEIELENVISFEGIPENILNKSHTIKVRDNNNFYFLLPSYNIDNNTINIKNKGGNTIFLLVKKKIKILTNNLTDKLGITQSSFSNLFKNNNPINLYEPYFYVKCIINNGEQCINNFTKNGLENIISKIYVNDYIKNENINTKLYFDPAINSLYKILFSYEYENNQLVDFLNMNSNFILRISYIDID